MKYISLYYLLNIYYVNIKCKYVVFNPTYILNKINFMCTFKKKIIHKIYSHASSRNFSAVARSASTLQVLTATGIDEPSEPLNEPLWTSPNCPSPIISPNSTLGRSNS